MRVLRRARVFKFGLNVPAVSAETALTAITRNGKTLISGVQYDAFGRPTTWRWADGQIARRRYDSGTGAMLANTAAYGYDWYAGRITTFSRSAQATVGLPAKSYAWDKNGNPTQITGTLKGMAIGVSSSTSTGSATTTSAAVMASSTPQPVIANAAKQSNPTSPVRGNTTPQA